MFSGQTLYTIYNTTYLLTNHQILYFLDVNTINYTKKVAIICEISSIKFLVDAADIYIRKLRKSSFDKER